MTILYGIKNCDSVKKAKKWLDENNIPYQFHDFKTDGLDKALLNEFMNNTDLSLLLNKRSTTFRNLSDEVKNNLTDEIAIKEILAQPTLLKRPILSYNHKLTIAFNVQVYQEIFNKH